MSEYTGLKQLAWESYRDGYALGRCVETTGSASAPDSDSQNPRKSVEAVNTVSLSVARAEFESWWQVCGSNLLQKALRSDERLRWSVNGPDELDDTEVFVDD